MATVSVLPVAPRLTRLAAADLTAGTMRNWITCGELPPGTRLPEEQLCEALGVSRNTLREAFRLLGHERLVVHELNRGVFVRTLTAADVADVFLVRELAELAGVRAARSADRALLRRVDEAVASGSAAARKRDWTAFATADLAFHRALAALAGSPRIDEMMRRVLAELRLAFGAVEDRAAFHAPYARRNAGLAELLHAGRLKPLERELRSYLADARDQIVAALDRDIAREPDRDTAARP
ncbi:MAG TPA: GntR family transcriptional regulator [Jatrophihabitans sp.]|nr:GntR family transcriptional regulator [Jatrophihabitans sp.]